jgi:hypothetical protein
MRKPGQLWRALPLVVCAALFAAMPIPAAARPMTAHQAPPAAVDLAIRFEALLGQHSVLAADLMRSRIRGDDDFVQAANAALGRNTSAMTTLMGQLFSADLAKQFGPMWSEHIVALFAYAGALAARDAAALDEAREEIEEYEHELADFLSGRSHGRLGRATARAAVTEHVAHLTMQADAYAKQNYAAADRTYRLGYGHSYDLGLALAQALLPAGDVAKLREPVWRLRSQLGKLLAEHAVLVEDLTRAAVTGTPDFTASGTMINGNTRDLSAAIGTLFGPAAGKDFAAVWGDHVDQLVAYASGTAAGDTGKQAAAKTALAGIEQRMATFLAGATGSRMDATTLGAALEEHDQMLLRHADAYAGKNYQAAHDLAGQTYDQMFELAGKLADAFGAQVAARLPRGGAQTGYGGMAAVVERR